MNTGQKIFFLGCGKMGSILVKNLIEENGVEPSQIKVLKKSNKNKIDRVNYVTNFASLPKNYQADLVFIAVKPQDSEEILRKIPQKIFHSKTIFVSILAGKRLEFFEELFAPPTSRHLLASLTNATTSPLNRRKGAQQQAVNSKIKLVRSMPNLPIQYSQGIFPYLPNKNVTKLEVKNLQKIFEKFGSAFVVKNEKEFDVLTAIFGSGPAYIFLLQEIFTEVAVSLGVNKIRAPELVKKLFLGSVLMSRFNEPPSSRNSLRERATPPLNSGEVFTKLRESVTSKGGTTEAALKILQKNSALKKLFQKAVVAATKKSQELSKK